MFLVVLINIITEVEGRSIFSFLNETSHASEIRVVETVKDFKLHDFPTINTFIILA